MRKNRHQVVKDTGDFSKHRPDPLGSFRKLNVQQLLDSQRETLLVRHHRHIVQPVKVRQGLHIGLVLNQLLGTTVQQSNVGIRADNLFAIEFKNQPKHTVSSRMLGTEIDSVMADLAADPFVLGFQACGILGVRSAFLVCEVCEGRVGRDESRRLVAGGLGRSTREGGGYRASGDSSVSVQGGGAETKPFGRIARQASKWSSHSGRAERRRGTRIKRY